MSFVKDKSYRELPFSSETPSDGNPCFLTVKELVEKIAKTSPGCIFRCRTVGIVTCDYGQHVLHEIGDEGARVRLYLEHYARPLPHSGRPYAAQLFGFVQNMGDGWPILSPHLLQSIPAFIALRLRETMKWVIDTHYAIYGHEKKDD